jgi:hypothetical protein
MNYVFDIFLTEEDYIDFNIFHMSQSAYGKKHQRMLRGMVAVIFAVAALVNFWAEGISPVTVAYAVLLGGLGLMVTVFSGKFSGFTMKLVINNMKKTGKMAFSPESRMGFADEGILEITPEGRTEKRWESMERLCIREGKVWYLYMNNTAAFILPVEQIAAQTDLAEFRRYLESRCPVVERFEK